jgi:von Willebrand factor type A domain/RTX calcium-binding nonapeptide repeat (4 copies)
MGISRAGLAGAVTRAARQDDIGRRGAIALAACVVAALVLPGSAAAFGTVNLPGTGQSAEHERMTRAALACPAGMKSDDSCFEPASIGQLAGRTGTFGAVGQPDIPPPEGAESHCDDADYLDTGSYPISRAAATATLEECVTHMQAQFTESWSRARRILFDGRDVIDPAQVSLSPDCVFAGNGGQRAKCDVIYYLGRALHGVQDFYAHSNWADEAAPGARDRNNPPGLNRSSLPPFLDLRHILLSLSVATDLSTGCFALEELTGGSILTCRRRVRHLVLNKDKGQIDPVSGATSAPTTTRGRVGSNFAKAVAGAIADTRRQWADLRSQILNAYGPRRGGLMVCAVTHDDPVKDCQGRDIAIVIDSSGSNTDTDPGFLRVIAGQQFNASLTTAAAAGPDARPDRSAVVDFDTSATVISPLADPSAASFAGIDASGGTDIGSGVAAAIGALTADANEVRDRTGIVVLTDGMDNSPGGLESALATAQSLGIRVSFGFLSPPPNPVPATRATTRQTSAGPPIDLVRAIDATGGVYSTINSAEAQRAFVQLVNANGAANLNDPFGSDDDGALAAGLARTARIANPKDIDRFTFYGERGRRLVVTVTPLEGQALSANAIDLPTGASVVGMRTPASGGATLVLRPRETSTLELTVSSPGGGAGLYTVGLAVEGVTLRGTAKANRLTCSAAPTLVLALGGKDRVMCGAGDDMIFGGAGRDELFGGKGDDVFVLKSRDVGGGIEQVNGGSGADVAVFGFKRPKGVRRRGGATFVPAAGGRFRVKNVETLRFVPPARKRG